MMIKYLTLLTSLTLMLVGCSTTKENAEMPDIEKLPVRWPNAVTYEIFVQSFYDGNGDGIGDFVGMTSKLDYLQDLGVEAIWLMPINPSPSYHKYDVTDYTDVHPDYGTMDEFKTFVAEAHDRDIKVVMDLVINHCSSEHPWFKAAQDPNSPYRDYFVWADMDEIEAEGKLEKEATGDSDNTHQWNEVDDQEELYYAFFWSGMPDLNYDNPAVREEVYKIGKFWLQDVGVDGFRLDAAKHIYPDYRAEDNHAFWAEFKLKMQTFNPDVYLVGEVWADLETQQPFAVGFSGLFNFDLAFTMMETVKNEQVVSASIHENAWKVDQGSPVGMYNESNEAFTAVNPDYVNTTFLTNHDQNRVMSFLENDERKARLAASILMTLPGAPYIYYGEEIGMRGMKPDELIREPFLWSAEDSGQTTWMEAEYSTTETVDPLDVQMNDSSSLYHHYRNLIRFRRLSDVMTFGTAEAQDFGDEAILGFVRSYQDKDLLVVHNLSDEAKQLESIEAFSEVTFSTFKVNIDPKSGIILPPFQSIILSK
ncbi:MAG: alpha-amylase [Rickettsiales bacterium]|nr:alpha-amylase [Rickettsiales bacterium]